ncbi:hypothetical protein SNE40_001607 [Patella caerulea]|uniref:Uncharacterized protein n=1 Tax=Patella caerulea TaxID=87958 RepID=A0AAN8KGA6_PATCE
MITYSRSELLQIGKHCSHNKLKEEVFQSLPKIIKPVTKRGVRGGRRHIRTIITADRKYIKKTSQVNNNNIITINYKNSNKDNLHHNNRLMNTCLLNCRSARNKADELNEYFVENDFDIVILTESWMRDTDHYVINKLVPEIYDYFFLSNRTERIGGGLAFLYKTSLKVRCIQGPEYTSFEYLQTDVQFDSKLITFISIYKPPYSTVNKASINTFFLNFKKNYIAA